MPFCRTTRAGHPHCRGVGGNFGEHHRIGSNLAVVPYGKGAQHLGAAAHHHPVAQGGVALAGFFAGASQGHPLVQGAVVSDDGGFSNHHPGAVVNKQSPANGGAGMDFDAGKPFGQLAHQPGQKQQLMPVEKMAEPVPEHCVKTGIKKEHLGAVSGRRVPLFDGAQVVANFVKHESSPSHQTHTTEHKMVSATALWGAKKPPRKSRRFLGRQRYCGSTSVYPHSSFNAGVRAGLSLQIQSAGWWDALGPFRPPKRFQPVTLLSVGGGKGLLLPVIADF